MGALFETISSVGTLLGVGANVLCPKPVGLAIGDLMVSGAWINTGLTSTMSPPGGWTKVRQDEPGIGNPKGMLSFKFADAADVAATDFLFTQSAAASPPWLCAIYRVSGAGGIDNQRMLLLNDIVIGSIISLLPALDTIADNVLLLRMTGYDTTGTEPTSVTDPGTDTRRAIEGGPTVGPGTSDIVGLWYTLNASPVTPPQTIVSAPVTMNGAAGRARSVQYAIGICPVTVFGTIEEAEARARDKTADRTWVNSHSQRLITGNPAVRTQRFMSPTDRDAGGWVDIVDSTVV
ncbi:MAG: hypothetical protein V3V96_03225 [Acidiferrobacterales bacterium]